MICEATIKKEKCKHSLACRILYLAVDSIPKLSKLEYWFFFLTYRWRKLGNKWRCPKLFLLPSRAMFYTPVARHRGLFLEATTQVLWLQWTYSLGSNISLAFIHQSVFSTEIQVWEKVLLCLQPTQGDQLRKEGKGAFVKASQGMTPLVAGVLWKASFDNQDTQGLKDQSSPFSLSCCRHKVIRYQKIANKTSMVQDIYMLSLS